MYLLAHKFGEDSDPYYVRITSVGWEEILNPHFATPFKTATAAKTWSKNHTTFGECAAGVETVAAREKFDKWASEGMIRRTFAILNKKLSRKYQKESPKEILDWYIAIRDDVDGIRYEDYKTWPDLHNVFKHIFNTYSAYSEDYKKLYHSFQIFTRRNGQYEAFEKELELILPHITYLEGDSKIIDVFDHYLSEHGNSVHILSHPDGTFEVKNRYSSLIKGKLEKVFEFLKTYRYYE